MDESTILRALQRVPASDPSYRPILDPARPGARGSEPVAVRARQRRLGLALSVAGVVLIALLGVSSAFVAGPAPTPTPLPGSSLIAYTSDPVGPQGTLYVDDLATGTSRALARNFGRIGAFSPDGTRLLGAATFGGYSISVIDVASGAQSFLSQDVGSLDTMQVWSSDGTAIVLADHGSEDGTRPPTLQILAADGSTFRDLTPGTDPAWSPDGRWIAFRTTDFLSPSPEIALWVIHPDGTGLTRVDTIAVGPDDNLLGYRGPFTWISWSPDSRFVAVARPADDPAATAYVRGKGDNPVQDFDIHRVAIDGSMRTQIANEGVDDGAPVWSPDGTMVAWVSDDTEGRSPCCLWVSDLERPMPILVTERTVGDTIAWSPDSTHVLVRETSSVPLGSRFLLVDVADAVAGRSPDMTALDLGREPSGPSFAWYAR